LLNVRVPNDTTFNLENIVDTLSYQNVYGKDIACKLEIQLDGGLKTLEGRDSLQQTYGTIMSTIRGSIPEFPEDGVPDYVKMRRVVNGNDKAEVIADYSTEFYRILKLSIKN
jgi:hypothetical protein